MLICRFSRCADSPKWPVKSKPTWTETLYYQMDQMPDHLKDVRIGGACALLKRQGSRTFEFCAREACQIMGQV
jgi:hypothetical protein